MCANVFRHMVMVSLGSESLSTKEKVNPNFIETNAKVVDAAKRKCFDA